MHGTLQKRAEEAREIARQDCQPTDTSVGDVLTDIAKLVLWRDNTAPNLAAAIEDNGGKCSVRQAERYLGGHAWSGDAVAAVMSEILRRRGVRHVRVTARR